MKIVLIPSLLSIILAAPSPQDVVVVNAGPDGVEVDEPSLLFVRPSFGEFGNFGRLPGFGQISGFGDFPSRLPASFGFEDSSPKISISLSDIFGTRPSEQGGGRVPAIINSLFDVLGDHLGVNGGDGGNRTVTVQGDKEYDHHNNTFEEKELPDGSVVRVNKTTIKDTDGDGNTFFFSSSVHHVLKDEDEAGEDGTELDTVSDIDDTEEIETVENIDEEMRNYEDEAEFVPTDIDESLNEIDYEEREREAKSEFPGVDASASVEGLFE